jgi:excisionase family DNA binding protein
MPPRKPKAGGPRPASQNGPAADVLTLGEAATYLRLAEADVVRLVEEQGLPSRRLGNEWRFLKGAIQAWLSMPAAKGDIHGI